MLEDSAGRLVGVEIKASATLGGSGVRDLPAMANAVGNVGFAEQCFTPAQKSFRLPPTCTAFRCRSFGRHTNNRNDFPVFFLNQHAVAKRVS